MPPANNFGPQKTAYLQPQIKKSRSGDAARVSEPGTVVTGLVGLSPTGTHNNSVGLRLPGRYPTNGIIRRTVPGGDEHAHDRRVLLSLRERSLFGSYVG